MTAYEIDGKKVAIVLIPSAGLGMVDGLLSLIPVAKSRPHRTLQRPRHSQPRCLLLQASVRH